MAKKWICIALLLACAWLNAAEKDRVPTTAAADGSILLGADTARVLGFKLHLEDKPVPTLVRWVDQRESFQWPRAIAHKGKYKVEITYSCPQGAGGSFVVVAGTGKIEARADHTDNWQTFRTDKLAGTLDVAADQTTLAIRSPNWIERAMFNFRSIKLTPVE